MVKLLVKSKYTKDSKVSGQVNHYIECLKMSYGDDKKPNKLIGRFVDGKQYSIIVYVSEEEYKKYECGDIVDYSTTTNEYDQVEYLLGKVNKNIFGK